MPLGRVQSSGSLGAQHIHPSGSWWPLAARSQEPCWAAGWLSSAQALPRHAQPGCASRPGLGRAVPMSCAITLTLATSPWGTKPSPGDVPGRCQGPHVDQQLWWHRPASSLPLLLSSRGQGCQPGPEEQSLLLQLLPPLSSCAKREWLLPDGQLLRAGLLWFFYLLCFSCLGLSAAQPTDCSGTQSGTGLPCSAGNHGLSPWGPSPCHLGNLWQLWWCPAVASNLFSQRCSILCRFI